MTGFDDFPVVAVDWMPRGTMLVGSPDHPVLYDFTDVRYPVEWDPPTYDLADAYVAERARGLVFVAGLLDDLCDDLGMDPDTTWRAPHNVEVRRRRFERSLRAYAVEARVSFAVHRPNGFTIVTGI